MYEISHKSHTSKIIASAVGDVNKGGGVCRVATKEDVKPRKGERGAAFTVRGSDEGGRMLGFGIWDFGSGPFLTSPSVSSMPSKTYPSDHVRSTW